MVNGCEVDGLELAQRTGCARQEYWRRHLVCQYRIGAALIVEEVEQVLKRIEMQVASIRDTLSALSMILRRKAVQVETHVELRHHIVS